MSADPTNPDSGVLEEDLASGVETPEVEAETTESEIDGETPVDDSEEVEHEGQKYRVPKALKPALMMHADYTRKTQEAAELRRSIEADAARIAEVAKLQQQVFSEGREVVAIDHQIEQLRKVDLVALQQSNPEQAQQVFWRLQQLQGERGDKVAQLQQKSQAQQAEVQRFAAKHATEQQAILARDIEGWSPDLQSKLRDFAIRDLGFTAQDLAQVQDARVVKLLHSAYVGSEIQKKQRAAAVKQQTPAAPQPIPVVRAQATSTPGGLSDKLPMSEWLKRRNAQTQRRKQ